MHGYIFTKFRSSKSGRSFGSLMASFFLSCLPSILRFPRDDDDARKYMLVSNLLRGKCYYNGLNKKFWVGVQELEVLLWEECGLIGTSGLVGLYESEERDHAVTAFLIICY